MTQIKNILNLKMLVVIFVFLLGNSSSAATESTTTNEVIEYVNNSIEKTLVPLSENESPSVDWELKRILVRVQSLLGIKIPWFASFQIVPEVEFIIER